MPGLHFDSQYYSQNNKTTRGVAVERVRQYCDMTSPRNAALSQGYGNRKSFRHTFAHSSGVLCCRDCAVIFVFQVLLVAVYHRHSEHTEGYMGPRFGDALYCISAGAGFEERDY